MKIYKISSPDHDKCYIGATDSSLSVRLGQHLYNFKNGISTSSCKQIFELSNDVKNVRIDLLEEVDSICLVINRARESFYINDNYDNSVNIRLKIKKNDSNQN
jgi:hypothetical protein|tara:strand:- start:416 stop:724 length:309 start_codon:yes stop_codon:yes gene_type:complete